MTTRKGPFTTTRPFVLASGSPRRQELLAELGLQFTVRPSALEEPKPDADEAPQAYVKRMAELKTLDVAASFPGHIVLGADTIVVLNDQIMGKPKNNEHALEMLMALSGKTHQVMTGFCMVLPDAARITKAVSTDVDMRLSSKDELKAYIATGEPTDKAGAYAIQGIGTFLVTAIRGSYTNVVGLPVAMVVEALTTSGVIAVSNQDRTLF
ncbi:septum formation inhibitor Maf [Pseudodesulfovibrio sp. JC047]|uniref:Maf family protein n=1 Tax=Pseudodesulfovibrio sp. JC047 TaxID=2683199 RepID=UPI0013D7ADA9|nr:Maf family protein [Pseudodesulfovibrio sp. JC047]NDV20174.1 septum formation inhibitor Maf [Pseudodesulfovibrio sp. JC047]